MQEKECNRLFLKAAITRQIFNCCDKHHYKAGVLIGDIEKIEILDIIINNVINESFVERVIRFRKGQCGYFIEFDNNSTYKIIKAIDGARGHRYNDLLIDIELDYEKRFNFGRAKILPYRPDDYNYDIEKELGYLEGKVVTLNIK